MTTTVRVALPASLRQLAKIGSLDEIDLAVTGTVRSVPFSICWRQIIRRFAAPCATRRATKRRRFIRFFASQQDVSHQAADAPLPAAIAEGREPFIIIGAIAGG